MLVLGFGSLNHNVYACVCSFVLMLVVDMMGICYRIGADVRGTASGSTCATVGGCLLTDLQAGAAVPGSTMGGGIRFGPLPNRARHLLSKAMRDRRYMCGLQPPSHECVAVMQKSAQAEFQGPLTMRGGEKPETSRGPGRGREGDALTAAVAAMRRPLVAMSGPTPRMGICEITNGKARSSSRGWAVVRRLIFTSSLFRQCATPLACAVLCCAVIFIPVYLHLRWVYCTQCAQCNDDLR